MSTQKIKVFVRCRPLNEQERGHAVEVTPERNEIAVLERQNSSFNSHETRNFYFDQVFAPEAKQEDVYKTVVRPLIDQVLLGFNCTVFAYGQTGTGKTYTMEGYRSDNNLSWEEDPHCGIIPRAISQLFNALQNQENKFVVRVSFLELYNEDAYDLLSPLDDATKLKIYDDAQRKGSVIVGGLMEVVVKSKEDIFDVLERGSAKRQTAATLLNACSSRSHTVFSITVHIREGSMQGEELLKIGKLNLVDLAGSENIGRSGAQDQRAREAGSINQALLTLGRVITALVENRPHVPYRESKLTRLLQDSLGGKTKTSLIATISPAPSDYEDTVSVLEYASRAKNITNNPEMNQRSTKHGQGPSEIDRLRKELENLQDRHSTEMSEVEFKVRNEVAVEFKREMEKMKSSFKQTYEDHMRDIMKNRDEIFTQLQEVRDERDRNEAQLKEAIEDQNKIRDERDRNEALLKEALEENEKTRAILRETLEKLERLEEENKRIMMRSIEEQNKAQNMMQEDENKLKEALESKRQLEADHKDLRRQLKVAEQLAEYRGKLPQQLEGQLQEKEIELNNLRQEITELRNTLHYGTEESRKANRIRCKAPVLEEVGEYANMTFDNGDEIAMPSAKKNTRKTVTNAGRKRNIHETITLSGKKKKIKNTDVETELSPIPTARVTRSRATRRKLNF